jgi:hypothetical protein
MPLIAGNEVFGLRCCGALQKLGVVGIGRRGAAPSGATSSPFSRNIAITAMISSGGNENLGRASTAAYSASTSADTHGRMRP